MAAASELPLDLRIDLAEAFIELSWARLPKCRTGLIEAARWRVANSDELDNIDWMLERILPMFIEHRAACVDGDCRICNRTVVAV